MFVKKLSAMILAAGYGKRLNPLTNNIPKPLIQVAGKPLLKNTIDLLLHLNCDEIIINTHFKHNLINKFIMNNYKNKNIILSYEKNILDTAGGIKNASSLFRNKVALIINSDIFWTRENIKDLKLLIKDFKYQDECKVLLSSREKSHGVYKKKGDFVLFNGLVKRYKNTQKILFYSGAQLIKLNILKRYSQKNFSFNLIWDDQIKKKLIFGNIMKSHWYHVGDLRGLEEAEKSVT